MAQRGADSGKQLNGAKGLGDIIVGTAWLLAEMTMMGVEFHSLNFLITVMPSMSGSPRSRRTRSGHREAHR